MLKKHIGPHFGKYTKVADVEFDDIDKLHRKVTATGSTYVANRCVALCSKMFSLAAIQWKMRDDNPCRGVERNVESQRKRYLSADELKRLTSALAEHPDRQFANIVVLLVLTGSSKVRGARHELGRRLPGRGQGRLDQAGQQHQATTRSHRAPVGGGGSDSEGHQAAR